MTALEEVLLKFGDRERQVATLFCELVAAGRVWKKAFEEAPPLTAVGIAEFELHVETAGPAQRRIEALDVIGANEKDAAFFARGAVDDVQQAGHRDALVLRDAATERPIEIFQDDERVGRRERVRRDRYP